VTGIGKIGEIGQLRVPAASGSSSWAGTAASRPASLVVDGGRGLDALGSRWQCDREYNTLPMGDGRRACGRRGAHRSTAAWAREGEGGRACLEIEARSCGRSVAAIVSALTVASGAAARGGR
jgi:hypothetical protein